MPNYLRTSFEQVADLYERARPSYPGELIDAIVPAAPPAPRVLEIGCGTGKVSTELAKRGCRLTCLDLGEKLASITAAKLAAFSECEIEVGEFETWNDEGRHFDLIVAVSAWHWIDPERGYRKAAELLRPNGTLAIVDNGHAFPEGFDPIFNDLQETYVRIGESSDKDWPPPPPDAVPDLTEEILASGCFGPPFVRRFIWAREYSADEYIELLSTYSGHIVMPQEKRDALFADVRRLVDARPSKTLTKHYLSILHLAKPTK